MSGSTGTPPIRYLPVDAGGQRFGIPLDSIEAVIRVEGDNIDSTGENVQHGNPTPIVDLSYLLKNVPHSGQRLHTVVVRGKTGVHALMVDGVYPIRTAEAMRQIPLPEIIGPSRHLFHFAVQESEQLVLVLNVIHLTMHFTSLVQEVSNGHK
jgi:chemotaxis signal transduction protein